MNGAIVEGTIVKISATLEIGEGRVGGRHKRLVKVMWEVETKDWRSSHHAFVAGTQ